MSEKLERAILQYKVPFSSNDERLDETTLDKIANYFYNLALSDIKEKVMKIYNDPENTGTGNEEGEEGSYCAGFSNACEDILDFIGSENTMGS